MFVLRLASRKGFVKGIFIHLPRLVKQTLDGLDSTSLFLDEKELCFVYFGEASLFTEVSEVLFL